MAPHRAKDSHCHASKPPSVSVYNGRIFLGHIFDRGAVGYECFDRNKVSLGIFFDQRDALDTFDALVVGEGEPPF
jgi:hypothetical protein